MIIIKGGSQSRVRRHKLEYSLRNYGLFTGIPLGNYEEGNLQSLRNYGLL